MNRDLQVLAQELQAMLGVRVTAGHITLNFNEQKVASVQTTLYQRIDSVEKPLDIRQQTGLN